jgi:hypothetical protein
MKSYKNFMASQTDDATPEIFQRRYDEYQIQCTKDASNYFFEKNKCEEWFRERYDPSVQFILEKETSDWSIMECKRLLDTFVANPNDSISGMRLSSSSASIPAQQDVHPEGEAVEENPTAKPSRSSGKTF